MNLRDQSVAIACAAIATPASTLTGGENQQGLPLTRIAFPDANEVYSRRYYLGTDNEQVTLDITDGTYVETFALVPIVGVPTGATAYLVVSGSLTDGTDPVVFPILEFSSVSAGKPIYQDGTGEYGCSYNNSTSRWTISNAPTLSVWQSTSDAAFPHLVTAWEAVSPATGTPTVTGVNASESYDPSGENIYGETIETLTTVNTVLIECLSGNADIEVNGNELKSVSAGEKRLCANANGLSTYLDTMEITATANNTEIRITVIGES
jgi:hypothetical protein